MKITIEVTEGKFTINSRSYFESSEEEKAAFDLFIHEQKELLS